MAMQQWKSKAQRWQQLTRYYLNKWQYDGSKWAERIWYGTGPKGANTVASVPFMITRNMRTELEKAGFPSHEISSLLPKVAHQLINDKISFTQFQETRAAHEATQQQQQQATADGHEEIKEMVAIIQAREEEQERLEGNNGASSATQIAIVPDKTTDDSSTRL